ncbi:hypothetical protein ACU8KH_02066 [Lachancea thermotolerans]
MLKLDFKIDSAYTQIPAVPFYGGVFDAFKIKQRTYYATKANVNFLLRKSPGLADLLDFENQGLRHPVLENLPNVGHYLI